MVEKFPTKAFWGVQITKIDERLTEVAVYEVAANASLTNVGPFLGFIIMFDGSTPATFLVASHGGPDFTSPSMKWCDEA